MTSIFLVKVRICHNQLKYNYRKRKKPFNNFLLRFWNLHQILKILKKRMTFIAYAFPKLQLAKDFVRPMSKKHRFRTPFNSQHVKVSQTIFAWIYKTVFLSDFVITPWKLSWKISLLVICKISGRLVNTFTADEKYFFCNSENLVQTIQMQLAKKQKN